MMSDGRGTVATRSAVVDSGRVDWPAIIAGAVVAAGTTVVITTFASALGLGSISVGADGGVSTLGLILTGIFSVVSMVAVYLLGGYLAGRLRRRSGDADPNEVAIRDGLHGLVVWGLGMLIGGAFALSAITGGARTLGSAASTVAQAAGAAVGGAVQGAGQLAGGVVSGAGQAIGGLAQGAGSAAGPTLADMLPQGMQSNPMGYLVDTMMRPGDTSSTGQPQDTSAIASQVSGILLNVVRTGEISDADRAYLRNLVASRTGLSPDQVDARVKEGVDRAQAIRAEAQKRIDSAKAEAERLKAEAEKKIESAKAEATRIAEKARVAGILTAFLLAASALVAAAAAYKRAVWGGGHRDEGRIWGGLSYRPRV